VGGPFVQKANNLQVVVDSGPTVTDGFSSSKLFQANILYATVTVCALGARPAGPQPEKCVVIDHVQVDTGSVGLRLLATAKVKQLGLLPIQLDANATAGSVAGQAWEYFEFVIGGLWGPTAVADVGLGDQWVSAARVQLIQEDNAHAAIKVAKICSPQPCTTLDSVSSLGSNGILGIGNMPLDCGLTCLGPNTMYYSCPVEATSATQCNSASVGESQQIDNPVFGLPNGKNNGVVLALPAVTGLGAGVVLGELIFGINSQDTQSDNYLDPAAKRIHLGTDWLNSSESYLNITTLYDGKSYSNSYLDTGTNGLFFDSATVIARCSPDWYCPKRLLSLPATLTDGDLLRRNQISVTFFVGDALFTSGYYAFGDLAGPQPTSSAVASTPYSSFSWGLPFFYGKRVFLSNWDLTSQDLQYSSGPWYSWSPL
jgi:hypothetical protein